MDDGFKKKITIFLLKKTNVFFLLRITTHEFSYKIVRVITIVVSNPVYFLVNALLWCQSIASGYSKRSQFTAILLLSPPSYILYTLEDTSPKVQQHLLRYSNIFEGTITSSKVQQHLRKYRNIFEGTARSSKVQQHLRRYNGNSHWEWH